MKRVFSSSMKTVKEARDTSEEGVDQYPSQEQLKTWKLESEAKNKAFARSLNAYNLFLWMKPNDALIRFKKGRMLLQNGYLNEAIETFQSSLEIDENYKLSHVALGSAYQMKNCNGVALEHYVKALEIDPNYSLAHFGIAVLYSKLHKNHESLNHFQKALRLDYEQKVSFNTERMEGQYKDLLYKMYQDAVHDPSKVLSNIYLEEDYKYIESEITGDHTVVIPDESKCRSLFLDYKSKAGDIVAPGDEISSVEMEKVCISLYAPEAALITDVVDNPEYSVIHPGTPVVKYIPLQVRKLKPIGHGDFLPTIQDVSAEDAANIIKTANNVVVLSGSGLSKESGLKTRKEMWTTLSREKYVGNWNFTQEPERLWELVKDFLGEANFDPKPNPAHYAVADLEKMGYVKAVITQNVDNLHQVSGSTNVIEMHGTLSETICTTCDVVHGRCMDYLNSDFPPKCPSFRNKECCVNTFNTPGILKPNVILFGDLVDSDKLKKAYELVMNCDVLLVVGTAADVTPCSELPAIVSKNGGTIIEVKRNHSRLANHQLKNHKFVSGEAATILPAIVNHISKGRDKTLASIV